MANGPDLAAVRRAVDLTAFRDRFCGSDDRAHRVFAGVFGFPILEGAYAEVKEDSTKKELFARACCVGHGHIRRSEFLEYDELSCIPVAITLGIRNILRRARPLLPAELSNAFASESTRAIANSCANSDSHHICYQCKSNGLWSVEGPRKSDQRANHGNGYCETAF